MSKYVTAIGLADVLSGLEGLKDQVSTSGTWVVGTNVEYSVYVELGTSRMQAQPYLRPAVREVMGDADAIADRAASTDALIRELATRIERRAKELCPVDTGNLRASIEAERIS